MTKKDYLLIANVFRVTAKIWIDARAKWLEKKDKTDVSMEYRNIGEKIDGINKIIASMDVIVQGLSYELKKQNPAFDSVKFRTACGLPEIKNNDKVYPQVIDKCRCGTSELPTSHDKNQCKNPF